MGIVMSKKTKVRVLVSIASSEWAYQPNQVVEIDSAQARAWITNGLASAVPKNTPLSEADTFDELSAEESRHRICSTCEQRRGQYALRGRSFCSRCFRAQLGVGK
jgi:hypothetical protein